MQQHNDNALSTGIVFGRNPVREALKAGRPADALLVVAGANIPADILALARKHRLPVKEVPSGKLDKLSGGQVHQGVALSVAAKAYASLDEVFALAESRGQPPFLLLCDGLTDPHNLGALIRSAEACGVHGVILPERGNVGLTATVDKSSAGALEHMLVVKVKNLVSAMEELKRRGVWLYCADMDGNDVRNVDFSGAAGIVVGSEGDGVGRLVKETCDLTVSIPMRGKVNSLNASVAGGILMFEASKGRD